LITLCQKRRTYSSNINITTMRGALLLMWAWKLMEDEAKRKQQEEEEENDNHRFISLLDSTGRRRRDRRIARPSLLLPEESPWSMILNRGNDACMITATGLDNQSFFALHRLFYPYYKNFTPYSNNGKIVPLKKRKTRSGRPRMLSSEAVLGLVLTYNRTSCQEYVLCQLFGLTATPLNLWLKFGRMVLVKVLRSNVYGRVERDPSQETVDSWKDAITSMYPSLKDVYCVADGLKLMLESTDNDLVQSMFYNGWTHDHYVTNLLVFAPDGTIIDCVLNCPGSMHDSELAYFGGVYQRLREQYEKHGGKCVMDSAFCSRGNAFVIKSAQDVTLGEDAQEYTMLCDATSMRQAAEWGMRALQGSFPRLKARLKYEEHGERKCIIQCIMLVYNFRARYCGINQIRTTFMPHLDRDCEALIARDLSS